MDNKDFTKVAIWPTLPHITFIVVIFITVNIDLMLWTLSSKSVSRLFHTLTILFIVFCYMWSHAAMMSRSQASPAVIMAELTRYVSYGHDNYRLDKTRHHSQSLTSIFTIDPPSKPLNVHLNFVRLKHTANNTNWKNIKYSMIHNNVKTTRTIKL